MENKHDTIDLLVDIKGILRSCPRNPLDAVELQNEKMAEVIASKSVQILGNILGEIRSSDHDIVKNKILEKLKSGAI